MESTDHVYYLDNLCITTLQPDLSSYPSEFMTWNEPDADEYVYATIIWRIKGTGQQYPLQPGQSVIIASIAANHQQINADGGPTVDLTSAEFEGCCCISRNTGLFYRNWSTNCKKSL